MAGVGRDDDLGLDLGDGQRAVLRGHLVVVSDGAVGELPARDLVGRGAGVGDGALDGDGGEALLAHEGAGHDLVAAVGQRGAVVGLGGVVGLHGQLDRVDGERRGVLDLDDLAADV